MSSSSSSSSVVFCYDIVCPYAYIASTRIEQYCDNVLWQPVLLGGLYKNTNAPQGAGGSATDVMSMSKRRWNARDLFMQAKRHQVPLQFHPRHPVKSLMAMRLLTACPPQHRRELSAQLYAAYWVRNESVDDVNVLNAYVKDVYGIPKDWSTNTQYKQALIDTTKWASDHGAFGVPAVFVNNNNNTHTSELVWGQDRLHFIPMLLKNVKVPLPRYHLRAPAKRKTVTMFFDFSSPWSFIGYTQCHQIREVANLELVPILLGAVFKSVGTPNVPMNAISAEKRAYMATDMARWQTYWGESLRFPDNFPLRTVLPLRVCLIEPRVIDCVYRSAWQKNLDVGDPQVLIQVLNDHGFNGDQLVAGANEPHIKEALKANTTRALELGVFGVPSYHIPMSRDEDMVVFGQDRIDVVLDCACEDASGVVVPSSL